MVNEKNRNKPVSKVPKKSISKKRTQKTLKIVKSRRSSQAIPPLSSSSGVMQPREIQPIHRTIAFTREPRAIAPNNFEYEQVSPEIIPPNQDDLKVVRSLQRLDQYILKSVGYNKYGPLLAKTQNLCMETFYIWLTGKGLREGKDTYVYISDVYLTFIYGCDHEDPITVKNVYDTHVVEFMMDFVFRITAMKPTEYVLIPAAMMLFHIYLFEKGYLDNPPDGIVDFMEELEPHFMEHLKERFS